MKPTLLECPSRPLGYGHPVFVIAEAGVNHNGDLMTAYRLIDAAVNAGADAVKFQTFTAREIVAPSAPLASHHAANTDQTLSHFEMIQKLELPFEVFVELKSYCEGKGVVFISTPYDLQSARLLIDLKCELIKVASSEMTNFPLLDVIRRSQIPVILSTGMSSWQEIAESVEFFEMHHTEMCLLKCTSNYPASPASVNLRGIAKLKKAFPQHLVGFSDHSIGDEICLAALGIGVAVVEKHFTLDKNAWGPDHSASMLPDEFKKFVESIRKVEVALGSDNWDVQPEEISQRATMRKAVYTRRDFSVGELVTTDDVQFLRPSGGISPKRFFLEYQNRPLKTAIRAGCELLPEHF
jgi:sialic acid synthase SpsE